MEKEKTECIEKRKLGFMSQKDDRQLPASKKKQEIKVKSSPAAEAMKKAPDEAIARAIHDVLLKQKEGK